MQLPFFLFVLFFILSARALDINCANRSPGYYCIDDRQYAWCYGQSTPVINSCVSSLACVCGFTTLNPCNWPGQKPSSCTGSPGDIISGGTSSSQPTPTSSSSQTTPTTSSSSSSASADEPSEVPSPTSNMASAYFTNWPQYHYGTCDGYNCNFTPSNIDATHLTHIFYAFAVFDDTFKVKNYEWNDFDFYTQLQAKKKIYPQLKTLISIGGWNFNLYPSTNYLFSLMASTAANRKIFIDSAITYAHTHGFDGVDIDWEYPGFADQGGQPRDTENFTKLLREFRIAINKDTVSPKLQLSIAAPCGEEKIKLIQIDKFHKYLDWINLMAYDYHGSWDAQAGPHTALYDGYDDLNTDHATKLYLAAGVPSRKLILGIAGHGRTWTLAVPGTKASYGTAVNGKGTPGVCTQEGGFLASFEIAYMIKQGATVVEDKPTNTFYAYTNDQFVTYDTVATQAVKLDYACNKGFGGAFLWAMDLDTSYQMINAMYNRMINQQCSAQSTSSSSSQVTPPVSSSSSQPAPVPSSSSSKPIPSSSSKTGCADECLSEYTFCAAKITKTSEVCSCFTEWGDCLEGC